MGRYRHLPVDRSAVPSENEPPMRLPADVAVDQAATSGSSTGHDSWSSIGSSASSRSGVRASTGSAVIRCRSSLTAKAMPTLDSRSRIRSSSSRSGWLPCRDDDVCGSMAFMAAAPAYPFKPKSSAYLEAGQFWAIPLSDGRFACGRVLAVQREPDPYIMVGTRALFAGLLDWVGDRPPDAEAIAGAPLIAQGFAHIKAITTTGGEVRNSGRWSSTGSPRSAGGRTSKAAPSGSTRAPHGSIRWGPRSVRCRSSRSGATA